MRLYPPAWAMGRQARADFQLGDCFLPAKTTVLMSQSIPHRDARFFPDRLRFDPERFTPEAKSRRTKLTYFPFGAGVRPFKKLCGRYSRNGAAVATVSATLLP